MSEHWRFDDTETLVVVRITGAYSGVPFADAAIRAIAGHCRARNCWRVLIDLTPMQGEVPNMDRFLLGKHVARIWGRRMKVAIVTRPEGLTHFFENVAVNHGATVRMFTSRDEAELWLKAGRLA